MNKCSVTFFKDRFKFSAAHFTLFSDGQVERLHGHNYAVTVTFHGSDLSDGLLFPFHLVKPIVARLCDAWDERVLLPTQSQFVTVEERERQCQVCIVTPRCNKRYSFPSEDVVLLDCNNISSENLALVFAQALVSELSGVVEGLSEVDVSISESSGQKVTVVQKL